MIRRSTCPICNKELSAGAARESADYPFCSQRCRQVDFFRWCDGKYAIVEPLDPRRMDVDLDDSIDAE
jgi:uncharacterized protein